MSAPAGNSDHGWWIQNNWNLLAKTSFEIETLKHKFAPRHDKVKFPTLAAEKVKL